MWSAQNSARYTVSAQCPLALLSCMPPPATALRIGVCDPELRAPGFRGRNAPKCRKGEGRCSLHKNHRGGRGWLRPSHPRREGKCACSLFPGKGRPPRLPVLRRTLDAPGADDSPAPPPPGARPEPCGHPLLTESSVPIHETPSES